MQQFLPGKTLTDSAFYMYKADDFIRISKTITEAKQIHTLAMMSLRGEQTNDRHINHIQVKLWRQWPNVLLMNAMSLEAKRRKNKNAKDKHSSMKYIQEEFNYIAYTWEIEEPKFIRFMEDPKIKHYYKCLLYCKSKKYTFFEGGFKKEFNESTTQQEILDLLNIELRKYL